MAKKALDSKLKLELYYKGNEFLQAPMEQKIELCTLKSKLTRKKYVVSCVVTTEIPLYPLSFIPAVLVDGFNPETQDVLRYNHIVYPYVQDDAKIAQRTVILYTDFESAKEEYKNSHILRGYYPRYLVYGVLCTPLVSCGYFSVGRLDQENQ